MHAGPVDLRIGGDLRERQRYGLFRDPLVALERILVGAGREPGPGKRAEAKQALLIRRRLLPQPDAGHDQGRHRADGEHDPGRTSPTAAGENAERHRRQQHKCAAMPRKPASIGGFLQFVPLAAQDGACRRGTPEFSSRPSHMMPPEAPVPGASGHHARSRYRPLPPQAVLPVPGACADWEAASLSSVSPSILVEYFLRR